MECSGVKCIIFTSEMQWIQCVKYKYLKIVQYIT